MLFYFSATGNCLHVARNLDDNPLSIAQELKKDERVYQDETMEFPKQKDIKKQPVFTCLQNTDV